MKKIFTLVALFAAISMNAQTVYDFASISSDDTVIDAYSSVGTYTMDSKDIPSVNYTSKVGDVMGVTLKGQDGLTINYKNGGPSEDGSIKDGHKDNILKFAEKYMQADGKNVILTFSGLSIGATIELLVASKGDTHSIFDVMNSSAIADANNPTDIPKASTTEEYVKVKFTAVASTVEIKETKNGFRIISATVSGTTAVEDINGTAVKAQKIMENGQIYILKNGVKYNLLGAEVK